MGSGLVPWVGSAVVWDPGGPEAFQEEGSLSRRGALGPDPGRPQLGDDLSVKPRASLARGPRVWSGLGLGLGFGFGTAPGG